VVWIFGASTLWIHSVENSNYYDWASSSLDLRRQQQGDLLKSVRERHRRMMMPEVQEDSTKANADFDYSQPIVSYTHSLKDPKVYDDSDLVVVVLSARQNDKRRQAIRETWGRGHAVYFVIGGASTGINETAVATNLLQKEQEDFGDLLDSVHPESYRSLPYKLQFALKWIVSNCPAVQWILKVDDDMYARVATVANILVPLFNPATPIVAGRILRHQAVQQSGKWQETHYEHPFYPPWPQGSCGYLLSRAAAQYVASNRDSLTLYANEDTSLGIWLESAQDPPVHWINSPFFVNHGDCQLPRRPTASGTATTNTTVSAVVSSNVPLVVGHRISPELMRRCYEMGNDEWNMTTERYFYLETHPQYMNRDNQKASSNDYFDDEKKNLQTVLERQQGNLQKEAREKEKKQRAAERAKKRQHLQEEMGDNEMG